MPLEFSHIIIAALAASGLHFWWKTMQAREQAEKLAAVACARENVQLLDGTVVLKKFAYEKASNNRRYPLRYFSFEFSSNRQDRRSGLIALYGTRQHYLYMDLPESPTISVEEEETRSNH